MKQGRFLRAALCAILAIAAVAVRAQPNAQPAAWPFEIEIEAFSHAPPGTAPLGDETLFVGSSSVRLWDTIHGFPRIDTVNRGFGGATTADVLHYYKRIIAGAHPASIIVYVGENDLAVGTNADATARDILKLLKQLHGDFPKARIAYLSMKPSPARWPLWPQISAVNARISAQTALGYDYLDVGAAMLTSGGQPDATLFRVDGLHMNPAGYLRWNAIVDRWLKPAATVAALTVR